MAPKRPLKPQYETVRVRFEGPVEVEEQNVEVRPEREWIFNGIQAFEEVIAYINLQESIQKELRMGTPINQYLAFLQHIILIIIY